MRPALLAQMRTPEYRTNARLRILDVATKLAVAHIGNGKPLTELAANRCVGLAVELYEASVDSVPEPEAMP